MEICIALGTRPEIIKMFPIIEECKKRNIDYFLLHSGQHYSYSMEINFQTMNKIFKLLLLILLAIVF